MNYATLLLPDFSLILCGYLICRYTALNQSVWQPVESLVYYLLFPVLLFQSIVKSPVDIGAASGLIAAGLAMGLTGIALAYSLPHWPLLGRHIDARDHAASAQVAVARPLRPHVAVDPGTPGDARELRAVGHEGQVVAQRTELCLWHAGAGARRRCSELLRGAADSARSWPGRLRTRKNLQDFSRLLFRKPRVRAQELHRMLECSAVISARSGVGRIHRARVATPLKSRESL